MLPLLSFSATSIIEHVCLQIQYFFPKKQTAHMINRKACHTPRPQKEEETSMQCNQIFINMQTTGKRNANNPHLGILEPADKFLSSESSQKLESKLLQGAPASKFICLCTILAALAILILNHQFKAQIP